MFDFDYYISYSPSDNQASDGGKGWVTNFQKFIEILITQLLGEKPRVLFLPNGEKPQQSQLAACGVMVSIYSPDYVSSTSCLEDLDAYAQLSTQSGLELKSRFFKVVKYPLISVDEPGRTRGLINYDLFAIDPASGQFEEIKDFLSRSADKDYWMRLADLAFDIFAAIRNNRPGGEKKAFWEKDVRYIYLAEVGPELAVSRSVIKRDLIRHGFTILPDETLPNQAAELEVVIKRDISRAELSLHMMADTPGRIIKDTQEGIVQFQNRIASEFFLAEHDPQNASQLSRVIWVDHNSKQSTLAFKKYIEGIRKDPELSVGAEVLEMPLEDFKAVLRERLDTNQKNAEIQKVAKTQSGKTMKSGKTSIYLIYDLMDEQPAKMLTQKLEEMQFDVVIPDFTHGFMEMRNSHLENLKNCDAFLIYKDQVNDRWIQMKALDTLKAPGLGRTKPLAPKCILHAKGKPVTAADLSAYSIMVLEETQEPTEQTLEPFLNQLSKKS
jgi:hypothetical protein